MAVISFSDSDDGRNAWVVAGSRFRQVLDEATARHPEDSELVSALDLAVKVGYLYVQNMDPVLANRVRSAIRAAARELMRSSEDENEYVDEQLKASVRDSMSMLLKASGDT